MVTLIDNGDAARVGDICDRRGNQPGELIEILHDVQAQDGFISKDAMRVIADRLNISQAEVYGVATFYHDFRCEKPGRTIVKICRAEACQAIGSEALAAHAEGVLGTPTGSTSADGEFALDAVYCLGNCALGPAVMINGALHGRVSQKRFDELVAPAPGNASRS